MPEGHAPGWEHSTFFAHKLWLSAWDDLARGEK